MDKRFRIVGQPNIDIPGTTNENRITELERARTLVVSEPEIELDTFPIGMTTRIEAYSESYLTPKQRISTFRLMIPELGINKEYIAQISGRVNIPVTIPADVEPDTILNVSLYARDYLGNLSKTVTKKVKVLTSRVSMPNVINPIAMETVYGNCQTGITISGSLFSSNNEDEIHSNSDWKITEDKDGFSIIARMTKEGEFLSHTFIGLNLEEKEYYAWVRYCGSISGWSKWSNPVKFINKKVKVKTPVITFPRNNTEWVTRETPLEVKCTEFKVIGCEDNGTTLTWKICKDKGGENILYQETVHSSSKLYRFSTDLNLKNGEKYYLFCHYGSEHFGYSDWSEPVAIIEKSGQIERPIILYPENMQEIPVSVSGIRIDSSDYACQFYTDEHIETEYKICLDIFGNSIVTETKEDKAVQSYTFHRDDLYMLGNNRIYYLFVRYKGNYLGYSEWSEPIAIKTKMAKVQTPSILSPLSNSRVMVGKDITVKGSEYRIDNSNDTHAYTDWKITFDSIGKDIFIEVEKSKDLTEHTFKNLKLENNRLYYLWIRYGSSESGCSDWSDYSVIKAVEGETRQCVIVEPAGIEIAVNVGGVEAVTSIYMCNGVNDGQKNTDWKICSDLDGNEVIIECLNSKDKIRHKFTADELAGKLNDGETYYIFARHKGTLYEAPDWSEPGSFTAIYAKLKKPEIISPENGAVIYNSLVAVGTDFHIESGSDLHDKTNWKITDEDGEELIKKSSQTDLTSFEFDTRNLKDNHYLVSCQYVGKLLGESEWSLPIQFHRSKEISSDGVYRHSSEMGSWFEFTSVLGETKKVLVLDAKYRSYGEFGLCGLTLDLERWTEYQNINGNGYVSGSIDDVLVSNNYPKLSNSEFNLLWQNNLSKIQDTKYVNEILSQQLTPDTRGIVGSKALELCQKWEVEGKKGCLPNIEVLMWIMMKSTSLDILDITVKDYPEYALINNPYGWWSLGGTDAVWSCTMSGFSNTYGSWCLDNHGKLMNGNKQLIKGIIPIILLN